MLKIKHTVTKKIEPNTFYGQIEYIELRTFVNSEKENFVFSILNKNKEHQLADRKARHEYECRVKWHKGWQSKTKDIKIRIC